MHQIIRRGLIVQWVLWGTVLSDGPSLVEWRDLAVLPSQQACQQALVKIQREVPSLASEEVNEQGQVMRHQMIARRYACVPAGEAPPRLP